jgi:hypothetical protein
VLAALATAVALSGCSSSGYDVTGAWFSKPLDVFGRNYGFTYSELQEAKKTGPVAANDLVDQNGACGPRAAPAQLQSAAGNPGGNPAGPPQADAAPAAGVGIGMTECDVVYIAGQPNAVQLGSNPNGERTAVLTYNSGPRPGIYHFESGRLMELDRVAEPPPPPHVATKKPAKPRKHQQANDQS